MRYRTCVLITKQELEEKTGMTPNFVNGKCNDAALRIKTEDVIRQPVVGIRDISNSEPDMVMILTAPGHIQDKTVLSPRMSIIAGMPKEDTQAILLDMIMEREDEDIIDIYNDYVLGCDAVTRNLVEEWLKDIKAQTNR